MNEPASAREQGGFDPQAFSARIEARLQERPDLQRIAHCGTGLSLALAVAGLVGLWRWRRSAAAHPPRGLPAEAGWGLALPLVILLALPGASATLSRLLASAGWPATTLQRLWASALALALLAGLGLAAAATRPGGLTALGLRRDRAWQAALRGLGGFVLAFPLVGAAQFATAAALRWAGLTPQPNPAATLYLETHEPAALAAVWIIAVVLAPLSEEAIFRGLLYASARRRLGPRAAALASAALFALLHPPADMPAIFVLGLALAAAFEHTGSLIAPLALHVANNLYGMFTLTLQRHLAFG